MNKIYETLSSLKEKAKTSFGLHSSNFSTVLEIKEVGFRRAQKILSPRINLLIPSVESDHIYGGVVTALKFFKEISQNFKNSRIIVVDYGPSLRSLDSFPKYTLIHPESDSSCPDQIVSLVKGQRNKRTPCLLVSPEDTFIATIWYTAYIAKQALKWQQDTFFKSQKRFIYFIQDYEPGFYPWSSQYLLAKSTYQENDKTVAVFNTSVLKEHFSNEGIKFSKEYIFEPRINATLLNRLTKFSGCEKQKIIIVYGRPNTHRNAFRLIVDSIRCWGKKFSTTDNWKILSAGEPHDDIFIKDGLTIQSVGKVSLEEYADLLGKASIGLSFMVSPHPSYPPLEMAHYGMQVITNVYANKDLSLLHDNITAINVCFPENIAYALQKACERVEKDPRCGWNGISHYSNYLSDGSQFSFVESLIIDIATDVEISEGTSQMSATKISSSTTEEDLQKLRTDE